ncbi:pyridoxine 5'-phosphate synthase [Aristophania vespae]|uniref:Pyridoxine 5'-phosphate synthase n=1 Tax=Aristophania vespae TaxID=2697033 RepID=A0A6P1NA63_9PROT|nr:pyridoxine 5'-phosphate synthase [Aristophania vespae]QHI95525.1 pyridoxine 5'-phosphate synthase [Aristophania vespae]UMM63177.1 Pyridoxine 5'-phosphate synthase [Aristophania vespae]
MIRLGVNIDHVATLRNARGEFYPDPFEAAQYAIKGGADGITAHLREDRRHIRDEDIIRLRRLSVPLNFEMAATEEMVAFACDIKPHACCLVPEKRQELTTEGGLDVYRFKEDLKSKIERLKEAHIRVSLFIDPDPLQIEIAAKLGAPVIELHTGSYAQGAGGELERLHNAALFAQKLGLEVHAGHGLTYENVGPIVSLPGLKELNIGHFLISQAVFLGIEEAVKRMKTLLTR